MYKISAFILNKISQAEFGQGRSMTNITNFLSMFTDCGYAKNRFMEALVSNLFTYLQEPQ